MSIRNSFVKRFGEGQALAIEAAAQGHKNGVHNETGSDPFKWAICICIGYECFTKNSYREYHKIIAPVEDIKNWIKTEGKIYSHDGDFDYLAAILGVYNEYMPEVLYAKNSQH